MTTNELCDLIIRADTKRTQGEWAEEAEYHKNVLRVVDDLKYIKGIIERGENRKLADDETVRSAILEYVKKLEGARFASERRAGWILDQLDVVKRGLEAKGLGNAAFDDLIAALKKLDGRR